MRLLAILLPAFAGCTCDIHLDSGSIPSVAVKPSAIEPVKPPPDQQVYEFATSHINNPATLARITGHGWQVIDGPATFQSIRVYHLRRPMVAEVLEKRQP